MQNKLLQLILSTLDEYKAKDVVNLDVRELTDIADNMVICSATSARHSSTLAEQVVMAAKHNDCQPLGVESDTRKEWILVDLGDVVIHIMQPKVREFYSLEKLWSTTQAYREADKSV